MTHVAPGAVREHRDHGQSSTEFLGLIVVVSAIIAVLAPSGFGERIADGIEAAICRIMGGSCAAQAQALSYVPEECTTLSHSTKAALDVTIFSVTGGGDATLTLSRTVDAAGKEHWYVQQAGAGRLGAEAIFGENASVGNVGEGVQGSVKALLTANAGMTMEFATEQEARDFMTAATHEPIKRVIAGFDPFGWKKALLDRIDGHTYDPPKPKEIYLDAGPKVQGAISGTAGMADLSADAAGSVVVGMKYRPEDQHKTVYLELGSEAAGKLGVLQTAEGKIGAESKVVVGIEYDQQGVAVKATLEADGTLTGRLNVNALPVGGNTTGTTRSLASLTESSLGPTLGGGVGGTAQLAIDLTQGANRAVVADGLHSLGVPVLLSEGSGRTPDPVTGGRGIYDLIDSGAAGTSFGVTTYRQTDDALEGKAKGGDGLGFGVEGGLSSKDRRVTDAAYYQPGQGFVTWQQCLQ
jgi:hypothetical protein